MNDKEKRTIKDGVINIFHNFNINNQGSTIGALRDDILKLINSLPEETVNEDFDKELLIEEKAKRYDEAIERAKGMYKEGMMPERIEYIFPELTESEDEKTRQEMLDFFRQFEDKTLRGVDISSWISYLEKQGEEKEYPKEVIDNAVSFLIYRNDGMPEKEARDIVNSIKSVIKPEYWPRYANMQNPANSAKTCKIEPKFKVGDEIKFAKEPKYPARKIIAIKNDAYYFDELVHLPFIDQDTWELVKQKPTDKVEPKFKVGDWVVSPNGVYWHIDAINNNRYEVSSTDWARADWPLNTSLYRLWTIRDAKDGDVLVAEIDEEPNDFIYIFKEYEKDGFWSHCYLDAYINEFHEGIYHNNGDVGVPATKEQRDLLFQKMKEAGYKWSDKDRKLIKME